MLAIEKYKDVQNAFTLACKEAEGLSLMQNAGAAFNAVMTVKTLRDLLTDEIMDAIFMPLMNTRIGFMTDRTGKAKANEQPKPFYTREVVRDCIIDAIGFGLMPVFNQFNIISERMYPTKEGYTHLLKKLHVKHVFTFGADMAADNPKYAEIAVRVNYEYNGEKNNFTVVATMPKYGSSNYDMLKGKAEKRAKKTLYEFVTGLDLGDAEEVDASVVSSTVNTEMRGNAEQVKQQPENEEPERVQI